MTSPETPTPPRMTAEHIAAVMAPAAILESGAFANERLDVAALLRLLVPGESGSPSHVVVSVNEYDAMKAWMREAMYPTPNPLKFSREDCGSKEHTPPEFAEELAWYRLYTSLTESERKEARAFADKLSRPTDTPTGEKVLDLRGALKKSLAERGGAARIEDCDRCSTDTPTQEK